MAFDATLWGQQATHTINVGQVPSSQSNVPLLITKSLANFPSSMLDGGSTSALNGGGDIRVSTDTAGANQLPVEIVSCVTSATPASQELIMWVRVPTVNNSEVIYITWNRAGQSQPPVTDTFGRNAVWQDYAVVLHLNDATTIIDSTGNQVPSITGTLSTTPGLYGDAITFTGTEYITVPNSADINACTGGGQARSLQAVLKFSNTDNTVIAEKGANQHFVFQTNSGALAGKVSFRTDTLSSGNAISLSVINDSQWHTFAGTHSGAANRVYTDATASPFQIENSPSDNSNPLLIGSRSGAFGYVGSIQGFRITNVELSADFISTENNNQSNQAAWATIGTPYNPGAGSGINVSVAVVNYDITALATDVNTPYDVLATASNYDINALTATVSFSGAVDVNVLPVNYDITALATTVAVSGDIDVIPQPANISYTAIGATVSLFGTIDVNIAVTNYNIEAYQAYVQNETISVECICGYEGVITTSINFDGIITGDIGLNGLIDDSDINRVGAIDNSDLAFKGGLCHCE